MTSQLLRNIILSIEVDNLAGVRVQITRNNKLVVDERVADLLKASEFAKDAIDAAIRDNEKSLN